VIKEPQRRRPRPDLGCRAIGWMDIKIVLSLQRRLTLENSADSFGNK
jgi:hypothetical protein